MTGFVIETNPQRQNKPNTKPKVDFWNTELQARALIPQSKNITGSEKFAIAAEKYTILASFAAI